MQNLDVNDLKNVYAYFAYLPPGRTAYTVRYRNDIHSEDREADYRWTPKGENDVRTDELEKVIGDELILAVKKQMSKMGPV